jgi:uncharacterized protein YecT (DUF1311 family)
MFSIRLALLGLLLPCASLAASFDCRRASTEVERLICADHAVSGLDDVLALAYGFESQSDDTEALRASQKSWLAERNRCRDRACLIARYEQRILQLCEQDSHVTGAAIGVNACSSVRLAVVERELEARERRDEQALVKDTDDPDFMRQVASAERKAWRAYRDAKCALQGAQEGGMPAWKAAYGNVCRVEETKARAAGMKR